MREPGLDPVHEAEQFQPCDVVVLPRGLPGAGVPAGSRAVVLEVHRAPSLAYEVEVSDDDGRTLFAGSVPAAFIATDTDDSVDDRLLRGT